MTERINMHLLHHILTESSWKFPDKDAVVFGDNSITYAELERRSSQLAFSLLQWGIKKGDRVGILLKKSIESIIALFGIMKAGAIYVPLDPLAPADRLGRIIVNCGIERLITSQENLTKLFTHEQTELPVRSVLLTGAPMPEGVKFGRAMQITAWEAIGAAPSEQYAPVELSDSSPAYILHTSGSTGTPKGVVISHLNALTFVNMAADFFGISLNDRIANHAPLHFDLSVFDIFCAVKSGATIVVVPEFLSTFPIKLAEFIDQERISIWNSVATVLTMLAERGRLERFKYDALRLVHFSGDLMPMKYLRILKQCMPKAEFYNIYGQTEANSSLFYKVDGVFPDDAWKVPIGKTFPNFDVFAIDDSGKVITRPSEEGELYVQSSTVALGYWNDEQKTREKFVPDPRNPFAQTRVYRTGDLVRLDTEGNYIFAGRKDHMIKSRGYRIELDEIEIVLNSHPSIRQAAVIAVPDELIGNRIIAYVSLIEGKELQVKELLDFCSKTLPKYMIPELIEYCYSLPVTSNGKIDRKSLNSEILSSMNKKRQSADGESTSDREAPAGRAQATIGATKQ